MSTPYAALCSTVDFTFLPLIDHHVNWERLGPGVFNTYQLKMVWTCVVKG